MRCPFTDKEVKYDSGYTKATCKRTGMSTEEVRYKVLLFNYPEISTYESIYNNYVNQELSIPTIAKRYNIKWGHVQSLLKYHKINPRSIKDAANTKTCRLQYVKTCQDTYGVDNISQIKEVKDKKAASFIKNYGVDNIWKCKKYYEWLNTYMICKFGQKRITNAQKISAFQKNCWKNLDEESKAKRIKNMLSSLNSGCHSKLETEFSLILEEFNITYERSFWLCKKQFDYRIKDTKILIEINGDFWHANPKKYNDGDLLNFPGGKTVAKDIWNKDKKKKELAKKHGYHVITIWEDEIKKKLHYEILFNEIKNYTENQIELTAI